MLIGIIGISYAEPLEKIDTEIIDVTETTASIRIAWNHDGSVLKYDVGCVSCLPNTKQSTTSDFAVLNNVSTLNDGTAIMYVLAYNSANEIITAKQIVLLLK